MNTPSDHLEPNWGRAGRVHEWKNYISDEIKAMWLTLSPELRAALARQADETAAMEEWE